MNENVTCRYCGVSGPPEVKQINPRGYHYDKQVCIDVLREARDRLERERMFPEPVCLRCGYTKGQHLAFGCPVERVERERDEALAERDRLADKIQEVLTYSRKTKDGTVLVKTLSQSLLRDLIAAFRSKANGEGQG